MITNRLQSDQMLDTLEKFSKLTTLALDGINYIEPTNEALKSLRDYADLPFVATYTPIDGDWMPRSMAGTITPEERDELDALVLQAVKRTASPETETDKGLVIPLRAAGGVVAALVIQKKQPQPLEESDKRFYRTLAGYLVGVLASAVGNSQLLERRLTELELIAQVSAAIAGNLNVEELLQSVSDLVKIRFGFYHAHIYLYNEKTQQLVLAAGAGEAGKMMKLDGHSIPLNREHSLVARAARTQKGVTVNDVRSEPDFLPNPLLPNTRSELSVPMLAAEELIGVLDVQSDQFGRFTNEDVRLKQILADEIAVAVQNARLYTNTRDLAANLEIVQQVATVTAAIMNVEEMLTAVCDLTKSGFKFYHVHIYLFDEEERSLVLRAGAGEVGRMMKLGGHSIPLARERSLVARAARERKAVIVNDTRAAADHLPNPLLPSTRSEMAVPMIVGDKLIGVLDVQSDVEDRFRISDIKLMAALGEQVSVAAQNATLYQNELETSKQLRQIDHPKSEFLASMSHELRTPLNSIIGYAEVLIDGIDGDLPDEARLDVQAIYDSGQHLLGLINQILDLAKIEAGHMELDLEEVDFSEVAREVERITHVLVKDKDVALKFEIPEMLPRVLADHQRLRQILNNLVSNAIKFTEKGEVRVTASTNAQGDKVVVKVSDTGIGIAPEHISVVFEQFRQVDNSLTRRFGGTGLGLPITLHLVQMHGGTIDVQSTVGSGSAFTFTIPVMQITINN